MNKLGAQGGFPKTGGPPTGNTAVPQNRIPGAQSPQGPFTPPAARPGQPPTVAARLPAGVFFQPGSVIHGNVAGADGKGNYKLQLGDQTLTAKSSSPLQVGQSVQFRVQGENQGQLMLQQVKTNFTKLDSQDLSTSLATMRLPASEANVQLAKSMVEHGVPLTKENVTSLMAQTTPPEGVKNPPPIQARVASVLFLQQNQIPVTPQNMLSISQFLASNPQIGQQMFAVSGELKGLARKLESKGIDLTKELPGILGEKGLLSGEKKTDAPKTPPKKLFNMAKQTGIESNLSLLGGGSMEEDWDIMAEVQRLRFESQSIEGGEGSERLLGLLRDIEGNLEAQKLINQAHPEQLYGFYYLQMPLQKNEDGVEVWIRYQKEDDGQKYVDPDDCRLEFLVTTENLGELLFTVDVRDSRVQVTVGAASEEIREGLLRYAPLLQERVEWLGYEPVEVAVEYQPDSGRRQLVESTDFEQLEGCNVQA